MNKNLKKYLNETVMIHINIVREAFKLCANPIEVNDVIGRIPNMFGDFDVDDMSEEQFTIVNSYAEYGGMQYDEENYDWYEAEDLKNTLTEKDIQTVKNIFLDGRECGHPYCSDDVDKVLKDLSEEIDCFKYNMCALQKAIQIAIYGYEL